jgi:multidrug efflux pump subunit AcrA (membrane-fusion protein)
MKRFTMLGIIAGAALLTAAPVSIQWSQKNVGSAAPTALLTLSQAEAQTAGMQRRETRRTARQAGRETRRAVRRGAY